MLKKYYHVFGLSLFLLVGCATSCRSEPAAKAVKATESKKESAVTMYTRRYADVRRSSQLAVKTQALGKQVWFAPFKDAAVQTAPSLLLVDDNGLTVEYVRHLQRLSFDAAFGWLKERDSGFDLIGDGKDIFYVGTDEFLHAVTADGKERFEEFFIPRVYGRGGLQLVVPLGQDRFLMQTYNRPEEVEFGKPRETDKYSLLIKGPASYKDIAWSSTHEGIALPGLVTADGTRLVVLNQDDQILVFDIATGKALSSAVVNGAGFVSASLDLDDNVIVSCWDAEDNKSVRSMNLKGEINWVYLLGGREIKDAAQPPVLGDDGVVYLIANDTLWALNKGVVDWSRQLLPARLQYVTLLDDALLVVSGHELRVLGRNGQERFVFRLAPDETITTPPVVDSAGRIYIGSTKGVYCVN